MPLSVKVSFQTKDQHRRGTSTDEAKFEEESRRFSIDEDVASNYEYFRAKVLNILPCLKDKAFRMYWKDDEGDLVTFSSDDELIEALGHVPDNGEYTFRVYIRELNDVTYSTPPIGSHCASRGCGNGIGFLPLHQLFAAYQDACGGRPGRAATCSNGHADAAQPSAAETSSSSENQGGGACGNARPGAAADDADEKMDERSSQNCRPTVANGDSEQREAGDDTITNLFSVIGSLLTSFGTQENQSQTPGENSQDKRSSGKQTNDVTGPGENNGTDGHAERGATPDPTPRDDMSNDGLIQVVETLKEMGFKDDNGSLSRLVATHSGQIERILQFIQTCRATC